MLNELFERRDAAQAEYEEFITPIAAEDRALTEDEETKRTEIRSRIDALDARIDEVTEDEAKKSKVAEARRSALGDAAPQVADETVRVTSEERTYGEGSPNSYYADFVRASSNAWKGHKEALERLNRHGLEVDAEMRAGSAEGKRAAKQLQETHRTESGGRATREILKAMETRSGMDTSSGSGGSFVTPEYFVSDYAPYRQFGRVFADQTNKQPLPEYGMTIYIPSVSGPAGVGSQVSQNSGVLETDPSAGYLSTGLTTLAGQVVISQQLLDRAGPNFQFDKMVFDQLTRAYNLQVDVFVLTQALANAGAITYTSGSPSFASSTTANSFVSKVAGAKAAIADTAGTVLPATHIFTTVARWEYFTANALDSQTRSLITPNYGGAFNAFGAGGDGAPLAEGDTGYKVLGLPVFEDNNIPTPGTGADQAIVAHMPEVWFWEGDLVNRVIPQTYAQNLSVLLDVYAYVGVIARYQKAVQAISGTGMATITF